MWVRFEVVPSDDETIYLPSSWPAGPDHTVSIKFGGGSPVRAAARPEELEFRAGGTFEDPGTIRLSSKLCERLHLPASLVYQIKAAESRLVIGPVIGLLLGIHTHRYTPKHMRKYSDRLGVYHRIGGLIYAFSPKSVDWEKREAFGLFYNIATGEWEYGCFPLPEAIYRRDFHSNPLYIQRLTEFTGGRLFNSHRFSKMDLYNYLVTDDDMKYLLPPTETSANADQVIRFIDRYNKAILKPIDLSRGRGMCIIEKFDTFYQITDYRYKRPITSLLNSSRDLEQFFNVNPSFFQKYLIQKYLNLAKIGNSKFDVRVVMQKHTGRVWGCTGIECRASNNSHLTNISRGGFALTLPEALEKAFVKDYEYLADEIVYCCHQICRKLDRMGHHFAEFGLDIAVDENKEIWLIEANVFPSFKGFKKTDRSTYLAIRYTPLLYALSLTEFGNEFEY